MNDEIVGVTTEGEPVFSDDLDWHLNEVRGWLDLKLGTGACAKELGMQLAKACCRIPQKLGEKEVLVDFHNVCDQIERLEGKSPYVAGNTIRATQFRHTPLKGLWHSHWFQAAFMAQNIALEMQRDNGKAAIEHALKLVGDKLTTGELTEAQLINAFTHSVVFGGYERRASRKKRSNIGCLTGEWIVYAKSNNRNIYLSLGSHDEDAVEIKKRCLSAVEEFPELRDHPAFQ